jgi:hypothetical protein
MNTIIRLGIFLMTVAPTLAMAKQNSIDMDITFKNPSDNKIKAVHVTVPVSGQIDANDSSKTNVLNKDMVKVLNPSEPMQDWLQFSVFKIDNQNHAEILIQSWSKKCPMADRQSINHMHSNKAIFCGMKTESIGVGETSMIVVPESGELIATAHRTR